MRIITLDDDKSRQAKFFIGLKKSGVELIQVWNAEDCIKALQDGEYNLVYLDHDLVGVFQNPVEENTGSEVVRWVVANKPKVKRFITHSYNHIEALKMTQALQDAGYEASWEPFSM